MNIREVEAKTGLKKANIRYYEQEGLLAPKRNKQNNYREYSSEEIEILERVKFLRMLGVSIEDIRRFQKKECTIAELMGQREKELQEERKQVEELQKICQIVKESGSGFDALDLSLYDLKTNYFRKKGVKIMRLDKIKQLKQVKGNLLKIWNGVMLAYLPVHGALKLAGHSLPESLQYAYVAIALVTVVGEIYLNNRIQKYSSD